MSNRDGYGAIPRPTGPDPDPAMAGQAGQLSAARRRRAAQTGVAGQLSAARRRRAAQTGVAERLSAAEEGGSAQ